MSTAIASEHLYSKQRDLPSASEGSNMSDLLSITESAVRALDRLPTAPFPVPPRVQTTPVLGLYNAFRDYDSDASGSVLGSVDSHSTSAGSVLINSTSNIDVYQEPLVNTNRTSAHINSKDRGNAVGTRSKPVRLSAKNLREVPQSEVLGRRAASPGGSSGCSIHLVKPSRVKVIPEKSVESQMSMGNEMRRPGREDVDVAPRVDPWMNGSSSTGSLESAEEERRRWMALDESYRHQPTNSGSPRVQDSDGKFDLSTSGKDIRAVLPLRDSGYMTQGIHTIRATETMGVTEGVADMEDSNSTASRESAIVIHGREESDLSNRESECSTEPSIVTIPQTIVNVRSTASAVSSSSAESSGGTSDSEPFKPFVALKDRFLKFRPVLLKQGTLTSEVMLNSKEMSDELHIEQFLPNEKQQRLRQDFLDRQTGNVAIRKCVPARIITGSSESGDARKVPESSVTSLSAVVPDFVASAAVAAVIATQTVMKSQQQEILDKISELESKKSESGKLSLDERMLEEQSRRKLETLEAQLASLTQRRLEELERHLDRQEKQQLDVQAQLHAMSRRPPSAYDGRVDSRYQSHGQRQTDGKLDDGRSWVRFTDGHPAGDMSIIQDMEREKMSVLETPAPRQKRPMPTMYDRASDRVNEEKKRLSPTNVNRAGNQFLSHVIASHDREMMGRPRTPQSPPKPLTTFDRQFSDLSQNARALPKELNVMKDVPLTPERPPPSPLEPAPLGKYLRKSMLDTSPYPEIRGFGESRLASLVQYAEAEAVLKNVHVDCDILESNLKMIERSRQDRDIYSTMGHSLHDRPFSDKIQIKRLVGQRINVLNRQIEAEVAVELIKQEKLNEAKKFMYPEKDNLGIGKRPSGRPVAGRPRGTGPVMGKFVAHEKENLPKTTKSRAIKKPRPLNPIEDESLLQRIYGKTLYHKLRSSQNGQCSHSSPKSKLPRTPVHIPNVQVKGVEMASARTQTKFAGQSAPPGQYVQGLQGQLIPMAIPLSLYKMDEHVSRINESLRQRSPKKKAHVTLEMPKQLRPHSPMEANVDHFATVMDEEAEEEEQESTMTEEGQVISLPGHTSPPTTYHGPKFPVRIPTMQPSPSSDVLAADIRRTDLLQKQAIDWVEQELMARIISEMYSKGSEERKHVQHLEQRPDTVEQDSSVEEDGSKDGSVHDSVVVDTIGQHGVQLFVDAGHPISGDLVSALIREVLAEKIGSMFGPASGSDVQSSAAAAEPRLPSSKPEVIPVTDNYYIAHEHQRSFVPTPEPTPEPSSTHSPVQLDSLPSTPRRTPDTETKASPVAAYEQKQEAKSEEEEEEEDVSFPTYEGMSHSDSQNANVDEFAGPSGGNMATPDVTPVPSPPPVIRTPSPSTAESIQEPAKETKATQADLALPIEVPVVAVPTEEPMEERADSERSLKFEKLPPKSEVSSPEPTSNMSPKDEDSVEPPTEVSTTNNENVSEGQWLITLLSEGEIPDIHLDEALRQRVRQHMINASKLHHSVDEDTFADEIEQDLVSEVLPSEGELQAPQCRLSDQEVIVKVVTRPKSLATYGLLTSGAVAEGLRVSRSFGELRIGPDFGELMSHDLDQGIRWPSQRKMNDMGVSKGSSFDENHVSLGEYQFDQASGKVYGNQPSRRVSDKELVPPSVSRGPASPVGRTQSDERFRDRVSTKTISIAPMKDGADSGTVSPPGTIATSQNRQIMSQPVRQSSERTAGGTRAGLRGRAQVGAGLVMSTQEAGNRGRRPQLTSSEGARRPKSPPQKSLPSDIMRQSYETDFSQTGSQLTRDFRDSRTPDQMNIDTLIQSHDYQSEFGSTGQSVLDAGTLKGKPVFQSTYSLVKSVDTEQGASVKSSIQPEPTETMGSKKLEDSLEGTGASQDNLEYSRDFEDGGSRSEEMKYQMPVKIPSISTYEEGSESDVSEISLSQQNP